MAADLQENYNDLASFANYIQTNEQFDLIASLAADVQANYFALLDEEILERQAKIEKRKKQTKTEKKKQKKGLQCHNAIFDTKKERGGKSPVSASCSIKEDDEEEDEDGNDREIEYKQQVNEHNVKHVEEKTENFNCNVSPIGYKQQEVEEKDKENGICIRITKLFDDNSRYNERQGVCEDEKSQFDGNHKESSRQTAIERSRKGNGKKERKAKERSKKGNVNKDYFAFAFGNGIRGRKLNEESNNGDVDNKDHVVNGNANKGGKANETRNKGKGNKDNCGYFPGRGRALGHGVEVVENNGQNNGDEQADYDGSDENWTKVEHRKNQRNFNNGHWNLCGRGQKLGGGSKQYD